MKASIRLDGGRLKDPGDPASYIILSASLDFYLHTRSDILNTTFYAEFNSTGEYIHFFFKKSDL
jgi:hypothetical protein